MKKDFCLRGHYLEDYRSKWNYCKKCAADKRRARYQAKRAKAKEAS